MLRIAHISDLHIRHPNMDNDNRTRLQSAFEMLGRQFDVEVEADAHDDEKLFALVNILRGMEPDVIVVTGDLTNFGDAASFQMAGEFLEDLRKNTGAQTILCVPGNHDCLCERAAALQTTRKGKWIIRLLAKISPEVAVMSRPQPPNLNQQFLTLLDAADGLTLLENYENAITNNGFGTVDPSNPVLLDAGWGQVALFLFNSVNEPGFMANKGRIGQAQFNLLNRCLQDPEKRETCANAVRIALLHHHPISAPLALDGDVNRLYDWMSDGPMMLQYLNKQRFHFILHGHQHEPFQCSVNYQETKDGEIRGSGLHIVAAGSATQGKKQPHKNSFNLIDLLTPFEARLRRYDYWGDAGFDHAKTALDVVLPVRSIEEVRVTDGDSPTVEDWAMQQLVLGANKDAYDIDSKHQYDRLDYYANIDQNQTYRAEYRRVGKVVGNKESDGLIFVVTGSPKMKKEHMNLSAVNNLDGDILSLEVVSDEPNQKVIHVRSRMLMEPGAEFDITLRFTWQATPSEPHDFDGINLMAFRRRVEKVTYRAVLAWRPAQTKVLAYGVTNFVPKLTDQTSRPSPDQPDYWEYSFGLEHPQPIAYLISFRPQ